MTGTGLLSGLDRVYLSPTTSGCGRNHGKHGIQRSLPVSCWLLVNLTMTKVTSIWNLKSTRPMLLRDFYAHGGFLSSFIIKVKAAEITKSGESLTLYLWMVYHIIVCRSVSYEIHHAVPSRTQYSWWLDRFRLLDGVGFVLSDVYKWSPHLTLKQVSQKL